MAVVIRGAQRGLVQTVLFRIKAQTTGGTNQDGEGAGLAPEKGSGCIKAVSEARIWSGEE